MTDRYLSIYLRDHLAAAQGGLEFVRRSANANEGNEIGEMLGQFIPDLQEEAGELMEAMELLGVEPSQLKRAGMWFAEKVGRLKLNGQLTGYSPLSRLLELEGLSAAVQMRRGLWKTMRDARKVYPKLRELRIDRFIHQAEEQLDAIDEVHQKAARAMLKLGQERDSERGAQRH